MSVNYARIPWRNLIAMHYRCIWARITGILRQTPREILIGKHKINIFVIHCVYVCFRPYFIEDKKRKRLKNVRKIDPFYSDLLKILFCGLMYLSSLFYFSLKSFLKTTVVRNFRFNVLKICNFGKFYIIIKKGHKRWQQKEKR